MSPLPVVVLAVLGILPPLDAAAQKPGVVPASPPPDSATVGPATLLANRPATIIVSGPDARVSMEPDRASAVVAQPPPGSLLEVVSASDEWLQVRLPRDPSGFERLGYILASSTRAADMPKPSPGAVPRAARPPVGVLDFDYATVKQEWAGLTMGGRAGAPAIMDVVDVGKGIADLLVDELLESGEVRLLDRRHLADIMREQDFAKSDRADPSAGEMAQLHKILGARFFVTGSVTKFGSEDNRVSGSALGLKGWAGFIAGFGREKHTARVGLTVRVIDSSTGEILASVKAEGQSKRQGLLLGGLGGSGFTAGGGGFSIGSSNFQETILGEATVFAVKDAAVKLCAAVRQLSVELPR